MISIVCSSQLATICWSLFELPRSVSRVVSAMVRTLYFAWELRALPMFGALQQGAGFGQLRFYHTSSWWDFSLALAFRVGSRFCVLFFHFYMHRSYFATLLGYEPSCTVVGSIALTHLCDKWVAEVRIRSPQSNRLWFYVRESSNLTLNQKIFTLPTKYFIPICF